MNGYAKEGSLYQIIESLMQVFCIAMRLEGAADGRSCRYRNMHPEL